MYNYHDNLTPHINHITLRVSSLEKSKKFYTELLGLIVKDEIAHRVVLGNKTEAILTLIKTDYGYAFNEGLYHIAFLLPSLKALGEWFLFQQKRNFDIYGASDHLVSKAFYFTDPDGNGIEVYADTDDTTWRRRGDAIQMDTLRLDIDKLIKDLEVPDKLDMNVMIGHLHMKTKNAQKLGGFYRKLGFDVTLNMGHAVFLAFDGYHHHLAFNEWNKNQMQEHNENNIDIDSLTIQYPNEESLDKVIKNLESEQVTIFKYNDDFIISDPMNVKVVLTSYEFAN